MILFNLGCDMTEELGLWVCNCSLLEVATSGSSYNTAIEQAVELCTERIQELVQGRYSTHIVKFLLAKGFHWQAWHENDVIPNSDENYILVTTASGTLIFRKGMTMLRRLTQ